VDSDTKFYRVRWRFDYLNRPSTYGIWNVPGPAANQACFQNKEGMIRASIEGEDVKTREIKALAECDGHDFRNFQWMAVGRMLHMPRAGESMKPLTNLVGMKLLTTNDEYRVYGTGAVEKVPLPESHKMINFATYGK